MSDADEVRNEFELLAEVVDLAILRADESGQVTYANPAARELLWRTAEGLHGEGWLDAVHEGDRQRLQAATTRVLERGAAQVEECRIDVLGQSRLVRFRLNAIRTGHGRPTGWVAIGDDITADREANDELTRQATHDALTGLPNRVLLEDRLALALARGEREGTMVSVFFLDLNHFKEVNDVHGHRVGDYLLREIASRIGRTIRGADTAARLGGDEFVVVAEGLDEDVAATMAQRIASAIAAPIEIDGLELVLRASVGVAQSPRAALSPAMLIHAADTAMYRAKRLGLDHAFASPSDEVPASD
ncbi:MAG: diguanylate cyclase [Acidimicrobiales bacterium]|nr:diguanylate cyclase [Acidimicrobiales bacterium]